MSSTTPDYDGLFGKSNRSGVRAVLTGQVGLDKKEFVGRVLKIARDKGVDIEAFHVGDRMYAEAPDIAPGRILDLPRTRLDTLRRFVLKFIVVMCVV